MSNNQHQHSDDNRYFTPTAMFFELILGYSPREAKRAEQNYQRRARAAGLRMVTRRTHQKRGER